MTAIAYIRVSTDEQVNGTSLDSQKKACIDYAKKEGLYLPAENIFREEGESAKLLDRPELARLLDFCSKNKGSLTHCIVWKVDRLARKVEYHQIIRAQLAKVGIKLVSVTEPIGDDAMGSLFENMLAAFAQFDNEIRTARTTGGMRERTKQGGWVHDAPPGYRKTKTPSGIPTIEPDETAPNVKKFLDLFATGAYTVAQSVELAYKLGIRQKNGKKKQWQGIKDILSNPLYVGVINTKFTDGESVKGLHSPIISDKTFNKIQDILLGNSINVSRHAEAEFPLRGGFLIHTCGNIMTGSAPRGHSGPSPRYHCTVCKASNIKKPVSKMVGKVHNDFMALLSDIRLSEGTSRLYKEIILRRWNDAHKEARALSLNIQEELEKVKTRKSNLVDLFVDGQINKEEYDLKMNEITRKTTNLELRLSEAAEDTNNKDKVIDDALLFMSDPGKFWNLSGIELKKRIQNSIFPEGIVYDCKDGFGTLKINPSYLLIKKIADESAKNPNLVGVTGTNWNLLIQELMNTYRLVLKANSQGMSAGVAV